MKPKIVPLSTWAAATYDPPPSAWVLRNHLHAETANREGLKWHYGA